MEEKPSKGKVAGMAAVVVTVSALMAWALIAAFQADQSRFDAASEDTYNENYEPPLEPEAGAFPEDGIKEEQPAKTVQPVNPAAPAAQKKTEQRGKAEPAKP